MFFLCVFLPSKSIRTDLQSNEVGHYTEQEEREENGMGRKGFVNRHDTIMSYQAFDVQAQTLNNQTLNNQTLNNLLFNVSALKREQTGHTQTDST